MTSDLVRSPFLPVGPERVGALVGWNTGPSELGCLCD